jgi:hypothetical protein
MAQCWPNRAALLVDRTLDRVNGQPKRLEPIFARSSAPLRAALVGAAIATIDVMPIEAEAAPGPAAEPVHARSV